MNQKQETEWSGPGGAGAFLLWSVFALIVTAADFITGPYVRFTVMAIMPIALAAWYSGRTLALILAVAMPLARYGFTLLWQVPWPTEAILNLFIRVFVFLALALFIDLIARRYRALEQEVRELRGILPICSVCKKIRTDDKRWEQLEQYISERSGAQFTHSLCPDCMKKQMDAIEAAERGLFGRRKDDIP